MVAKKLVAFEWSHPRRKIRLLDDAGLLSKITLIDILVITVTKKEVEESKFFILMIFPFSFKQEM